MKLLEIIKTSFALRAITQVLMGVFLTYLGALLVLSIYVALRTVEVTQSSSSPAFIIGFYVLGFIWAMGPFVDRASDKLFNRDKESDDDEL